MLIYNNYRLTYDPDTVSFVERSVLEERHYSGTNQNKVINKGRLASNLSVTVIVQTYLEMLTIKQMLADKTPKNLRHFGVLYRNVVTGSDGVWVNEDEIGDIWTVKMSFIINNPTPYDPDTGEALI